MEKLIYLYGIIPASGKDAAPLPSLKGLDEESQIYSLPFENVDAIVCELDPVEYSEKELEKNQMMLIGSTRKHFTITKH